MAPVIRFAYFFAGLSLLIAPARAAGSSFQLSGPTARGPVTTGAPASESAAACTPSWMPTFGGIPGTNFDIAALTVFDDGGGPALYAAGGLTTAGGVEVNHVAKWDGSGWSHLAGGLGHNAHAMAVFDDGNGPALYVGGSFYDAGGVTVNHVAEWDGSSWSPLGSGIDPGLIAWVYALTVFDDGNGPALYAGGEFNVAGGVAASNIAKWDGSAWSALGSGTNGEVLALTVFDDGNGPALYAGGYFTTAGGVGANAIAKWDGSSWSSLGTGMNNGLVEALTVFDDGSGPTLYAGGEFSSAGGVQAHAIAEWNGSSWFSLGTGIDPEIVHALTVFDDGSGPALYTGGFIYTAGGVPVNNVARWDGSSWSALGSGIGYPVVNALTEFDDGTGPALFAGGQFAIAGGVAVNNVAKWDGSSWSRLGSGFDADVQALTAFDDGSGPALYAAGQFTTTGDVPANRIAKWNGSGWAALGSGVSVNDEVYVLAALDVGSGPALYAGGDFGGIGGVPASNIAKWNGSSWSPLGSGTSGSVWALAVFDDGGGPALYAGGTFFTAGGVTVNRVAKWNGSSWSALANGTGGIVRALAEFDDGSGPALYVSGNFNLASGVAVNGIGRWNGTSWSAVGNGAGGGAYALTVFDDGGGPALYSGSTAVRKWDGTSWTTLGGANDYVRALAAFHDGNGRALYAGGSFVNVAGVQARGIAKWDGSSWSALGSGVYVEDIDNDDGVRTLAVFDDGGGPTLFAGGDFVSVPDSGDSYLARWGCMTPSPGTSFCFGDGSGGMIACPCGNTGFTGHGCANSVPSSRGASLAAFGSTSPDTVRLTASEERPSGLSIFLQGNANTASGLVYGDGIRCVSGALKRLYSKSASSGSVSAPGTGDLSIRARSAAAGDTIPPGGTRYYQVYYRDAVLPFCPSPAGNAWNVTNGIEIVWP